MQQIINGAKKNTLTHAEIGKWSTGQQLITSVEEAGGVVGASIKMLLAGPHFKFSEPGRVAVVRITPRDLGFKTGALPAEIRDRGLEVGLRLCPDDLAAAYMLQWSFRQTLFFIIRDINPKIQKGTIHRVTTFDTTDRGLGSWGAGLKIGPDSHLCFVA